MHSSHVCTLVRCAATLPSGLWVGTLVKRALESRRHTRGCPPGQITEVPAVNSAGDKLPPLCVAAASAMSAHALT